MILQGDYIVQKCVDDSWLDIVHCSDLFTANAELKKAKTGSWRVVKVMLVLESETV